MLTANTHEFWFVTGSQMLYGEEVLRQVETHSKEIVSGLDAADVFRNRIVYKGVVKNAEEIRQMMLRANADDACAGVITWMHTFSPSKMWISGMRVLQKPLLHFGTQFNRDIPWDAIDMDFMNLNQSAHGDREHGFITSRMNVKRKVLVGHWEDELTRQKMSSWMNVAHALAESKNLKVARFGDNMRNVAVTEGDKVEAQIQLGWTVDGYGVGDLVTYMNAVSESDLDDLMEEYRTRYEMTNTGMEEEAFQESVRYQGRIELGMKAFLEAGGYTAFTTTFEDLHGINQLPGLAVQRLMEQGYGFAGEGDWKTAALVRLMKIMASNERTSFMEDYTYHFEPGNEMVLGAHMLEICPTIAVDKPRIEVHPLGIGDREAPARMVFEGQNGKALNASLIDLGHRFRLLVNTVEGIQPEEAMPNLPVARVLWKTEPSMAQAVENWIQAGGAHHTCYSYEVTTEQLRDFAELLNIEIAVIDKETETVRFNNELRWNELYYRP